VNLEAYPNVLLSRGEIKRNPFLTQITFGESTDDINKKK
jgi:hypothetical protein